MLHATRTQGESRWRRSARDRGGARVLETLGAYPGCPFFCCCVLLILLRGIISSSSPYLKPGAFDVYSNRSKIALLGFDLAVVSQHKLCSHFRRESFVYLVKI